MKTCQNCNASIDSDASFCTNCGCKVENTSKNNDYFANGVSNHPYIQSLANRVRINGIIWLIIGICQCLSVVCIIVGILNIFSAINDLRYSKTLPERPYLVVQAYTPVGGAIITLLYNLIFGGVIGIVGSIYYLVAIRGFVMSNKEVFYEIDRHGNY